MLLLALGAAAQDESSLKKQPVSGTFTDPEKTFSIDLPREPFDIKTSSEPGKDGSETRYKWLLREGIFFVAVTTFKNTSFDKKTDVDTYVNDLAAELKKITSFRLASQTELTLGKFYGGEIVRTNAAGKEIIMRVYAGGHVMYTLTAVSDEEVEDAGPLLKAALASFKFLAAAPAK
jgi:hypothetical protein